MKLVENQQTGKRHLPGEDTVTACGESLIVDGKENATWIEDSWLDDYPEDYGKSHIDCKKCAKIFKTD